MHAQRTAAALGQHVEIATGLRGLDHAESSLLTGYREILRVIGGDLQKYAVVWTALISLTGGMQKTWTKFGTSGDMAVVAHLQPHVLQGVDMRAIALDIGEQRHIIASAGTGEMRFQPGAEVAI